MDGIPEIADDLRDLLRAFIDHDVHFLVIGGYALAVHGHPRASGDLAVWIECDQGNATRAHAALGEFGAPLGDLSIDDLATPGTVFQVGLPPLRIDVLTRITGVTFDRAWRGRRETRVSDLLVPVIGREALIENKRALGRAQDLADVEWLEKFGRP